MLKSVHFKSIKSLLDVRVELGRLTFLVGPNGCGKSTLLDQIEVLCGCSQADDGNRHVLGATGVVLDGSGLPTLQTAGDKENALIWSGEDDRGASLTITCGQPIDHTWVNQCSMSAQFRQRTASFSSKGERGLFDDLLRSALSWRAQRLRLLPPRIAEPVDVMIERLDPDGYGLAAVITAFALNDQDAYTALQADMRRIVPQYERLHISKVSISDSLNHSHGGVALGMVMHGAGRQPATAISDGTLLALALLTATHNKDMPPLVLMDDIDHGLHLGAQLAMVEAIRRVMEVRPELQVVCTTHSPYLLDAARPEEVRVMALDADGHTVVRPLTECPDFERHHKGLQTGEFWASLGEGWVTATGAARV